LNSALPTFGDTNLDGSISDSEDAALNLTLNADFSDLETLAGNAAALSNAGIDTIAWQSTTKAT
jgi:hypothetical protein